MNVSKKLFVGNIPYSMTDDQLMAIFSPFGQVTSAQVVVDRNTNRSRGFGFVEFENDEDASKAMSELDGSDQDGRPMAVKEARAKTEPNQ